MSCHFQEGKLRHREAGTPGEQSKWGDLASAPPGGQSPTTRPVPQTGDRRCHILNTAPWLEPDFKKNLEPPEPQPCLTVLTVNSASVQVAEGSRRVARVSPSALHSERNARD